MGWGDTLASRPSSALAALVVLSGGFLVWAFLALGLSVQISQALAIPRWAFWVCAAIIATLPIYLHAQKLGTFGSTSGDSAISTASMVLLVGYVLLAFTPLRAGWMTLFGIFND
jgi:hypothetical protein